MDPLRTFKKWWNAKFKLLRNREEQNNRSRKCSIIQQTLHQSNSQSNKTSSVVSYTDNKDSTLGSDARSSHPLPGDSSRISQTGDDGSILNNDGNISDRNNDITLRGRRTTAMTSFDSGHSSLSYSKRSREVNLKNNSPLLKRALTEARATSQIRHMMFESDGTDSSCEPSPPRPSCMTTFSLDKSESGSISFLYEQSPSEENLPLLERNACHLVTSVSSFSPHFMRRKKSPDPTSVSPRISRKYQTGQQPAVAAKVAYHDSPPGSPRQARRGFALYQSKVVTSSQSAPSSPMNSRWKPTIPSPLTCDKSHISGLQSAPGIDISIQKRSHTFSSPKQIQHVFHANEPQQSNLIEARMQMPNRLKEKLHIAHIPKSSGPLTHKESPTPNKSKISDVIEKVPLFLLEADSSKLTSSLKGQLQFELEYTPEDNSLTLLLIRGESVGVETHDTDMYIFVRVYLVPGKLQIQCTGDVKQTKDPQFDELFTFNDICIEKVKTMLLRMKVYSYGPELPVEYIGEINVPLGRYELRQRKQFWRQIEDRNNLMDVLGRIHISLQLCTNYKTLTVVIGSASELIGPFYSPASPSPYVKVEVRQHHECFLVSKTTKPEKNTQCPTFKTTMTFDLIGVSEADITSVGVVVSVFQHEDKFKGPMLGQVKMGCDSTDVEDTLQWQEVCANPGTLIGRWHYLRKSDDVFI